MDTWVERLKKEYAAGERTLRAHRDKLKNRKPSERTNDDIVDMDLLDGMLSDMNMALEWMRRGRRPGNRRGIDRRGVYERAALLDPQMFPSLDVTPKERTLTDDERRMIVEILWDMSKRERECYLLHMSYGMSFAEIGTELHISRNTVRTFIDRAKAKIPKIIS